MQLYCEIVLLGIRESTLERTLISVIQLLGAEGSN